LLEDGGSDITTLGGLWNLLGLGSLNESLTTALNNAGLLSGIVSSLGGLVTTGQLEAALDNVSLGTLLGGNTTNITGLLNDALNLGDLLNYLGLSSVQLTDLPSILDLGDLSNLTLGDLLGDLGLGDLANISVDPLGGLITELVDTVPQQILAAL
jgi:hypothetical protein